MFGKWKVLLNRKIKNIYQTHEKNMEYEFRITSAVVPRAS